MPLTGYRDVHQAIRYPISKGNKTSSGDTEVIPADPLGRKVVLYTIFIVNNDTEDCDFSLQLSGTTTDVYPRIHVPAYGGPHSKVYDGGIVLSDTGQAIDLNVSGAGASPDVSYIIQYWYE